MPKAILRLVLLACPATLASAQNSATWIGLPGSSAWDGQGMQTAWLGDLDGDGFPEFASGAHCTDFNGFNSGSVSVYDGRTLTLLRRHDGPDPGARLGEVLTACGDVDGDGIPDYAAGAPRAMHGLESTGAMLLYSGATGALLLRVDGDADGDLFGAAVCAAGDVDGDGWLDLLVGAPGAASGLGRAVVLSGRTGARLRDHVGSPGDQGLGTAVRGVPDCDGDGVRDYVLSAPGGTGQVTLRSGSDGSVLRRWTAPAPGYRFGFRLASPGDLDGDGRPEILVAEPCLDRVLVYSATSGSLLRVHDGGLASGKRGFGHALLSGPDLDGDGVREYLLGAPGEWPAGATQPATPGGEVLVIHGRTGRVLERYMTGAGDDAFGGSVAGFADLDGDGRLDLLAGAPAAGATASQLGPGMVYAILR